MSEAVRDAEAFSAARRASLMTQSDMGKVLHLSTPRVVEREKHPETMTLDEIGKWYESVGTDGKVWVKEYVLSFLL